MNKLSELRKKEEKRIYKEVFENEHTLGYLRNFELFNALSLMSFIMGVIIIITASVYKKKLIIIDDSLVSFIALIFIIFSLVSLVIAYYYNGKTIDSIKHR